MNDKANIDSIAPLHYQYQAISEDNLPRQYNLIPIEYRKNDLNSFDIILFHRLLKKNFGYPSNIETKDTTFLFKDIEHFITSGKDWKYFIMSESNIIFQIGTENDAETIKIYLVAEHNIDNLCKSECNKFIDKFLREAKRESGKLFNLRKEIEQGENIDSYSLDNLFLQYYNCAELMLEHGEETKQDRYEEIYHHLPLESVTDQNILNKIDRTIFTFGAFHESAAIYFFRAIEGFINIFYHTFLVDEYRTPDMEKRLERLDIDLKLLLMPSLCYGFKEKYIDNDSNIYKSFMKFKEYRNNIVHSKITDYIKRILIIEDNFGYCINIKADEKSYVARKGGIAKEGVLLIKNVVDELINDIVAKLDEKSAEIINNIIKKEQYLTYKRDDKGFLRMIGWKKD